MPLQDGREPETLDMRPTHVDGRKVREWPITPGGIVRLLIVLGLIWGAMAFSQASDPIIRPAVRWVLSWFGLYPATP